MASFHSQNGDDQSTILFIYYLMWSCCQCGHFVLQPIKNFYKSLMTAHNRTSGKTTSVNRYVKIEAFTIFTDYVHSHKEDTSVPTLQEEVTLREKKFTGILNFAKFKFLLSLDFYKNMYFNDS